MPSIGAILFDFDGTIIDSSTACMEEVADNAEDTGLTTPDFEFIRSCWGMPFEKMMEQIRKKYGWSNNDLELYYANVDFYKQPRELFDGVEDLLKELASRKIVLGIISSRKKASMTSHLENLGIYKYFEIIQGLEDCSVHKPDPRVFDLAIDILKQKEIQKERIIYIGDTLPDLMAAKNANLLFVGITSGAVTKEEFQQNGLSEGFIIDNPCKILNILKLG